MTFSECYEYFRIEKSIAVKPSTKAVQAMHWKMVSPAIADKDISEFGRTGAIELLSKLLEQGLSPKTAKDRMAFVKQLLIYGATNLEVKIKPTEWHLKYPKGAPRQIKCFTEAEMLRIVRYADTEINDGRYTVLPVLISILTGMRIGETLALKWNDIDWTHRTINVHRNFVKSYDPEAKTEKYFIGTPKTIHGYREIPMLPVLYKTLRKIGGKESEKDYFVVGNSDKPKLHSCVRDSYNRFLQKYKLPKINYHGLRHTYATLLVESGGDIKTISTLLGHANVSMTLDLYVHPSINSKRKVVNKAFKKLNKKEEI